MQKDAIAGMSKTSNAKCKRGNNPKVRETTYAKKAKRQNEQMEKAGMQKEMQREYTMKIKTYERITRWNFYKRNTE